MNNRTISIRTLSISLLLAFASSAVAAADVAIGTAADIAGKCYAVGDTVNIVDEIFDGFTGTVEEIDVENNLVRVSVSALFGKETKVELELDQVEPIGD